MNKGARLTNTTATERNLLHLVAESGSVSLAKDFIKLLKADTSFKKIINQKDRYHGADLCFLIRGRDRGRYTITYTCHEILTCKLFKSVKSSNGFLHYDFGLWYIRIPYIKIKRYKVIRLDYILYYLCYRDAWHYVEVSRAMVPIFLQKTKAGNVDVALFGTVIRSGWGVNPDQENVAAIEYMFKQRKLNPDSKPDMTPLHTAVLKGLDFSLVDWLNEEKIYIWNKFTQWVFLL